MARGINQISIDDFSKKMKLFFYIIIGVLLFGTIGFSLINSLNIFDAFVKTLLTLSFIFTEDASLIERMLEIFLSLIGVFCIWWVLWTFADLIFDGSITTYLKNKFRFNSIMHLQEHIIIVGGGRIGQEIAKELTLKKIAFVIIEINDLIAKELSKKNILTISGDAQKDIVLEEANIKSAKKLIITTPKTETNLFIILSAKEINNNINIITRAEKQSAVSKLKRAGAEKIFIPEIIAGKKIVDEMNLE